jgi:tellurite resistance protein TerC
VRATCPPTVRKAAVVIAGFAVLLVGFALIVLPGPAIVVIPLGLAILAKELPWARRLLDRLKGVVGPVVSRVRSVAASAWAMNRHPR